MVTAVPPSISDTAFRLGRRSHPYRPDVTGTSCAVPFCWGRVDDPRHTAILTVAWSRARTMWPSHEVRRAWSHYDRCPLFGCSAAPRKPCLVQQGRNAGQVARQAHSRRPLLPEADRG